MNLATREKLLQADNAARQLAQAKAGHRKIAKEVLDDFMHLFAGIASKYQPPPADGRLEPGQTPNEDLFEKYARLAVETAAQLAKYQSPQFRAVMHADAPPMPGMGDGRTIDHDPNEKVSSIKDALLLTRVYQRALKGP